LQAASQATKLVAEAEAAESRKDDAAAEQRYRQVLQIAGSHPGLGPGLKSVAYRALSQVEVHRKNFAKAEELMLQRLEVERKLSGPVNTAIGETLEELGGISYQQEKETQARAYFEQALKFFESCANPANPRQNQFLLRSCQMRIWEVYGLWGGQLFLLHKDAEAEPLLRKVVEAPEDAVNSLVLLTCLRAQISLLARNGRDKEAREIGKRAVAYEHKHPDAAARIDPWSTTRALDKQAASKVLEITNSLLAGTLGQEEDFAAYGKYAGALRMIHNTYFSTQEDLAEARRQLEALDMANILSPETISNSAALKRSHEKVRAAMFVEDKLVVKNQSLLSDLENRLRARAQSTSTSAEERAALEAVLTGFVLGSSQYHQQIIEIETGEHQTLATIDKILSFLEARAGRYTVKGQRMVFENPEDEQIYNGAVIEVRNRAAQIVERRKQMADELQKKSAEAMRNLNPRL